MISLTILSAQLAIEDEDTADIVSEHLLAVHRPQSRRRVIIKVIGVPQCHHYAFLAGDPAFRPSFNRSADRAYHRA
nr:hypothetical protein [Bacillus licheniformis]